MNKKYDVYGLGAALVDTEITLTDQDLHAMQVEKGVMTLVNEQRQNVLMEQLTDHLVASKRASGGSAANTVIGASYFGCRSFYSCKVANDDNGHFYLADLRAAGVDVPLNLSQPQGITGKCLVLITPDAERTLNTFLGVSETLSVTELDLDAAAASHFVYVEGYLVTSPSGRAAAIALFAHARSHGTRIALSLSDPAMVQFFRDGLLEMIGGGVDLLFCNKDEAIGFTQADNLQEACERLQQYAKRFVITCGANGALLFDGNELISVVAPKVNAIDSNGAGDMFAGAFLYGLSQGKNFAEAGEFACNAAAKVVSQFGPRLKPAQYAELKMSFGQ